MLLKHIGPSHERSFHKADFTRFGMEGQGAVAFNQDNNHLAEIDDEVAEWLLANHSDEFREATEADQKTIDLSRPNAKMHFSSSKAAMKVAEETGSSLMAVVGAQADLTDKVSHSGVGSEGTTGTATGGGSTSGGATGGGSTSGSSRSSRSSR